MELFVLHVLVQYIAITLLSMQTSVSYMNLFPSTAGLLALLDENEQDLKV